DCGLPASTQGEILLVHFCSWHWEVFLPGAKRPDLLTRAMPCPSQSSDELVFFVNGKKVTEKNVDPEVTLLAFLRRSWILLIDVSSTPMRALQSLRI
ncbi:hypothetical protein U0070_015246, partial [Myodes glareolus]